MAAARKGACTGALPGEQTHKTVARQKGLEPLAYCLEGSCSIQLSYWRISACPNGQRTRTTAGTALPRVGAGDGNRTHTTSLEGWDSAIELHPHFATAIIIAYAPPPVNKKSNIQRDISRGISLPSGPPRESLAQFLYFPARRRYNDSSMQTARKEAKP